MGWKPKQIRLAHAAARAADWTDAQRRTVLGGFDGRGRLGKTLSSKAPGLTNADFDHYMALAEADAGGQIFNTPPLHWANQANAPGHRQAHLIRRLVNTLKLAVDASTGQRVVGEHGERLDGIIRQATAGRADALDQLTAYDRHNVIVALKALVQRHGPTTPRERTPPACRDGSSNSTR
ncbi:MAG: hypothetical protein AAF333_13190 [Planctomycetota bacterium]